MSPFLLLVPLAISLIGGVCSITIIPGPFLVFGQDATFLFCTKAAIPIAFIA